jgi:nucleotide-binding universal stress UspA family protein
MKKILVPVDFSIFSKKALEASQMIAKRSGASIHVLYVAPPEWNTSLLDVTIKNLKQDMDNKLQAFVDRDAFNNIPVEKHIVYGDAAKEILHVATQQNTDLIVMGAYGKEFKNKYYIGSTLQKVLRIAPCPVLVVKNQIQNTQFKTLILAIKLDIQANKVVKSLSEIARIFSSTIHLVLINTPAKSIALAEAQQFLDSFQAEIYDIPIETHVYNFPTVEDGLASFIQNMGDCCLALATHEQKLSSLYLIGVTETMIYRLSSPVLSIKCV